METLIIARSKLDEKISVRNPDIIFADRLYHQ